MQVRGIGICLDYNSIVVFEARNKVCVLIYEIDTDLHKIWLSKYGIIDYLYNDLIYNVGIENEDNAHYLYTKSDWSLLSTYTYATQTTQRYCRKCSQKI